MYNSWGNICLGQNCRPDLTHPPTQSLLSSSPPKSSGTSICPNLENKPGCSCGGPCLRSQCCRWVRLRGWGERWGSVGAPSHPHLYCFPLLVTPQGMDDRQLWVPKRLLEHTYRHVLQLLGFNPQGHTSHLRPQHTKSVHPSILPVPEVRMRGTAFSVSSHPTPQT